MDQVETFCRFEHAVSEFVREQLQVRPQDSRDAEELFAWCRERLLTSDLVTEVKLTGSFARGTSVRPFHDIDALVFFDLDVSRKAGLHEGSNLGMHLVHTIIERLVPNHEIVHGSSWAFATEREAGPVAVRRQSCSVGVCNGIAWADDSITLDFVPAVVTDDETLQILHRFDGHVDTNPKAALDEVERLDVALGETFRSLVQLAKRWKSRQSLATDGADPLRPFSSFHLEALCADFARRHLLEGVVEGDPPTTPLLFEAFTDLLVYLRMHHRSSLPVPGTHNGLLTIDDSLRRETTQALLASSHDLQSARRCVERCELEQAAVYWQKLLGAPLMIDPRAEPEQYRPRWRRTMEIRHCRGPLQGAAETNDLRDLRTLQSDLDLCRRELSHVEVALNTASALDHAPVVTWILDHYRVPLQLQGSALTNACIYESEAVFDILCSRNDIVLNGDPKGPGSLLPIHGASKNMSARQVARLLELGADPNRTRPDGLAALHMAAAGGEAETAERLLAAGALVDGPHGGDSTPLLAAAEHDNGAVARVLLAHGADPCARSSEGHMPLFAACAMGSATVIQALMEHPMVRGTANESSHNGFSPLVMAAMRGHEGAVQAMLEHPEVELDRYCNAGWTALGFAVQEGHTNVAGRLLAAGASVDASRVEAARIEESGTRPLLTAANNGHLELVDLLLTAGAVPSYQTPGYALDALGAAVILGHHQIVRRLLQAGANADRRMQDPFVSPLMIACLKDRPHIAIDLLDAGASSSVVSEGRHVSVCACLHRWPVDLCARLLEGTDDPDQLQLALGAACSHRVRDLAVAVISRWREALGVSDEFFTNHHLLHTCDGCGRTPIPGTRHHCQRCNAFDLCDDCARSDQPSTEDCQHDLRALTSTPFIGEVLAAMGLSPSTTPD